MNYQKLFSKFNYMYTDTVDNDFYEDIITETEQPNNKTIKDDKEYAEFDITPTNFSSDSGGDLLIVKDNIEVIDKDKKNELVQDTPIQEILPEDVRWFYKAVQDKVWLEFSGYDSLRIENKYRNIYKEFDSTDVTQNTDEDSHNPTKRFTGDVSKIAVDDSVANIEIVNDVSALKHELKINSTTNIDITNCSIGYTNVGINPDNRADVTNIEIANEFVRNTDVSYNNVPNGSLANVISDVSNCTNVQQKIGNGIANSIKQNVPIDNLAMEFETSLPEDDMNTMPSTIDNNSISSKINSFNDKLDGEENNEHVFDPERRIVVRGGMYEVDLNYMTCESIYWPGEQCLITRGLYFYDATWQPIEMDVSLAMERQHLILFRGKIPKECTPDGASKSNPIVIHTAHFTDFHVAWLSPDEIYLYSENAPSKIVRSVTHRLGFQKSTGYRLRRGYRIPASEHDQPQGVSHLVFVIHGIGQKMDAGKIIRNTGAFRECVDWLKNKYFPSANHRAEFFPVEWRSSLKLDSDMVDAITPHNVMSIRHLLNCSAMDIMYYTSPLYGMEVQRGLIEELNRLHAMFLLRNPSFRGPVSVLAHSLGSVILYDVITGYQPGGCRNCNTTDTTAQPGHLNNKDPSPTASSSSSSPLQFEIEQLFCLGSPLSVFIALRLSDPNRQDVLPPGLCSGGFYNIFHLSDPVAYRMEPLLCKDYRWVAPLMIQPYSLAVGGDVRYHEMPLEMIQKSTGPQGAQGQAGSAQQTQQQPAAAAGGSWRIWSYVRPPWNKQETVAACSGAEPPLNEAMGDQQVEPPQQTSTMDQMEQLSPPNGTAKTKLSPSSPPAEPPMKLARRLDYAIRETGLAKNYWSAITSHTSYWTNYDVAYFVLTRLFPDLEQNGGERTGNAEMFDMLPV